MKKIVLFVLLLSSMPIMAAPFEVAITIDDLPAHMDLPPGETRSDVANKMLRALKKHRLKNVYGFINADRIKNSDDYNVLVTWVGNGQLLGNHTYSHADLDAMEPSEYIKQIQMNEPYLLKLMGKKNYHYFRYPYLYEGGTKNKRDTIREYLFSNNYKISQVTMDFSDYYWNNPYARCMQKGDKQSLEWLKKSYIENAINAITVTHELSMTVFQRDIKNILLLHIGAFDAVMLDDLLTSFKKHGVKIISLDEALQDPVYSINPDEAMIHTGTFLTQMRLAKQLPSPDIVDQLLAEIPVEKLDKLCR